MFQFDVLKVYASDKFNVNALAFSVLGESIPTFEVATVAAFDFDIFLRDVPFIKVLSVIDSIHSRDNLSLEFFPIAKLSLAEIGNNGDLRLILEFDVVINLWMKEIDPFAGGH